VERRLTAILAADVVGYSKLMGEDEAGTLEALRALRNELIAPTVASYRGNVIKSMGDGWLVEFPSAGNAVACAVAVQLELQDHPIIKLRAGLHVGDVTFEEEDVFGDGVNIAARLQDLAVPGAIIISDFARQSMDGRLAKDFVNLGPLSLKNIADKVVAFAWGMDRIAASANDTDKPSIAVLAFDNMSGDSDQAYFSDGITEDIITELSRYTVLTIIGRSSSFSYKGKDIDLRQVGNELSARYVVEGSIRKAGDRIRVTAQLIEAATGAHIWAERYDRKIEDIFDVQDEITAAIVAALVPQIAIHEQTIAKRKRPADLSLADLAWRAISYFTAPSPDNFMLAREVLDKAFAIDPNFANAHTVLSFIEFNALMFGWQEDPQGGALKGLEHAQRAVANDPNSPDAHLALSLALLSTGQWDPAFQACETVLRLTPSNALGYFMLGSCEVVTGEPRSGIEHIEKAMELSPRDQFFYWFASNLALAHYNLEEYEEAIRWASIASQNKPEMMFPYFNGAAALGQLGRLDEAAAQLEIARRFMPEPTLEFFRTGWLIKYEADFDHLIDGIRKAGLKI
jgi:adenylate cyclase